MADFLVGQEMDLLGPLGNHFAFDCVSSKTHCILVGGGIGAPPMAALAQALIRRKAARVTVLLGAATCNKLLPGDVFGGPEVEVLVATDDGSKGHHGFVTELLYSVVESEGGKALEGDSSIGGADTFNGADSWERLASLEVDSSSSGDGLASLDGDSSVGGADTLDGDSSVGGSDTYNGADSCAGLASLDGDRSYSGAGLASLDGDSSLTHRFPVAVFACGPKGMLKTVGDYCLERDIPCQLSLEEIMACGVGACQGCVCKIKSPRAGDVCEGGNDGEGGQGVSSGEGDKGDKAGDADDGSSPGGAGFEYVRVCTDGPVFEAGEVVWDE